MKVIVRKFIPKKLLLFKSKIKEYLYWRSIAKNLKDKILDEYRDCDSADLPVGYDASLGKYKLIIN